MGVCDVNWAALGCFLVVSSAYAESVLPKDGSAGNPEFVPHTGEQPVYGKKFFDGREQHSTYLELNPLLLIDRGVGVEFEHRVSGNVSLGLNLEYSQYASDQYGFSGDNQSFFVVPKIRFYPMELLSGVFLGADLRLGTVWSKITADAVLFPDSQPNKASFYASPAVHVGYRIVTFSNFTAAAYVGGGYTLTTARFTDSELGDMLGSPDARAVRDRLGDASTRFRLDYGFTLGAAI